MKNKEILTVLENAKNNMVWMWENLHKEHTSDHFNIPANAISEIESAIDKLKPKNKKPKEMAITAGGAIYGE